MAKYNMESHYIHEVDEKYKQGWEAIFKKQKEEADWITPTYLEKSDDQIGEYDIEPPKAGGNE